jgi:hypothetical protein
MLFYELGLGGSCLKLLHGCEPHTRFGELLGLSIAGMAKLVRVAKMPRWQ